MKKDEVTTMLRSAVSNAAPDVLDNVLHACDHEKGKVIYMEKKKNRGFTAFAAVAAVFVLLIAGIFIAKNNGLGTSSNALAAVVSLDVNPSIELKVDNDEDVISATGLNADGKKVLLCAGDTFRAAAGEQLNIWAERSGVDIVRHEEGSDPASVVYDSICAAKARGVDTIIIDTAGRLHNKANLMNELNKISRVVSRELPDADIETLMVLDATTGQNGLIQAKQFLETAGITGIVLTKLDGTAKGGIVFAIAHELNLPVKFVGVGEGMDDLIPFDPKEFVEALFK